MKLLLDTHVLLWFQASDPRLTKATENVIRSVNNEAHVSIISFWEISVKHRLGKLPLQMALPRFFNTVLEAGFSVMPLRTDHIVVQASLPFHHRDPFDRMLIAQASHEGMHLLTADRQLDAYGVTLSA